MRKIINYRVKLENMWEEKRKGAFVISRIQIIASGMVGWERE